jgi:hypothetical protein
MLRAPDGPLSTRPSGCRYVHVHLGPFSLILIRISCALEPAQAMQQEAHPMGPPQGQTAILESENDVSTVLITAESMRSEAHPELDMFPVGGPRKTAAPQPWSVP